MRFTPEGIGTQQDDCLRLGGIQIESLVPYPEAHDMYGAVIESLDVEEVLSAHDEAILKAQRNVLKYIVRGQQ